MKDLVAIILAIPFALLFGLWQMSFFAGCFMLLCLYFLFYGLVDWESRR